MEAVYKLLKEVPVLPASPEVQAKVLEALRQEKTTLDEISELVALDPVLTGKLLHYCNTVYFAGREPVASVSEAVRRVGFQTIVTVLSVVTNNEPNSPGSNGSGMRLWKHSLTAAFACKFVANDLKADTDFLFTAGLLHDIGRSVLMEAKGLGYNQLYREAIQTKTDCTQLEKETYGFTHADVGACLLKTWKLPESLVQAVRFHHDPLAAGANQKMAAAVCVGNILAHRFEHPKAYRDTDLELEGALQMLSLERRHLEHYSGQMQDNWDFVNQLIGVR